MTSRKEPKPVPAPRFAPDQAVLTKTTVRVKSPALGRKFLHLLPGTVWTVVEVDPAPNRRYRHTYSLVTAGSIRHRVTRKESRLRPAEGKQ